MEKAFPAREFLERSAAELQILELKYPSPPFNIITKYFPLPNKLNFPVKVPNSVSAQPKINSTDLLFF